MLRMNRRSGVGLAASLAAAVGLLAVAPRASAKSEPPVPLRDAGLAYETALTLAGAQRVSALEEAARSAASVLHGDLTDEEKCAARFLSGEIAYDQGSFAEAREAYRSAADEGKKTPFADDAAFAAIRALEAQGRDKEAAAEWMEWERRYPESPLMGEARLAESWNALRRGEAIAAQKTLQALVASRPWYETDTRVALARALAYYDQQRYTDALAQLGTQKTTASAVYLRALCFRQQGSLLPAAAAFQDVAERFPDSPLRDPALLAKADAFLAARDYRSAAEEFARVSGKVHDDGIRAEAELRSAGATLLMGAPDSAIALLHGVVERHTGTDVAARAQFLIGEALLGQGRYAEAIVALNEVLTNYFQHSVAAAAQYRVGRALDALGRQADATGTYQAVVSGYPLEPEAPAAAYLAGVGLLAQNRYLAAVPYFQLVLDRYASASDSSKQMAVITPERRELIDASLCLLELSYHRTGNLGQLAGAPHLLLHKMPPSRSPWRAYALLIDADASASQGRFDEAQATLQTLMTEYPDLPVGASATKLLAWTYARQGQDSLAISTEERLVARYGARGDSAVVSGAVLDIAHNQFNEKHYREAARTYEQFLKTYPAHPAKLLARNQAALCYVRLNRAGDAVDQWEAIVRDSADAPLAEKAWARAGDIYFQAQKYADAKRCYQGLLEHFSGTEGAALAMLRLAQCEYNAEHDEEALKAFSAVTARFPGSPYAKEAARGQELALYRLGQSAKGPEVLARLVDQYPTSAFAADALFQIAKRQYEEKHWAEAADSFRRVVSQFPGYSAADQAQFLLADAHARAGHADDARLAYEQFLSFFPQSTLRSTVEFRLGVQQFEAKQYAPAAVSFTRVLAESAAADVRSASRYNLALCQRLMGDTQSARAALEQYRADYPGDARAAEIAYQLGDMAESAGQTADAAKEYEAGLAQKCPPAMEAELAFRLGRCRETQNDTDGALHAYQRAAACPDRSQAFRLSALARCAAIYESRREFGKALAAYRDIAQNTRDKDVAQAAAGRASQLESSTKHKR